eukprot:scaffold6868_cov146-Skeletonema_dohrnii-CCMP3373.AAC.11
MLKASYLNLIENLLPSSTSYLLMATVIGCSWIAATSRGCLSLLEPKPTPDELDASESEIASWELSRRSTI